MGKKNALRFNVGGAVDKSTDVWRIWAHKDDVYFFLRTHSHEIHVSLHKSGVWKMDIDGKRFTLNKEVCLDDGWGVGPAIFFPHLDAKRFDVKGNHLNDKRIEILPSAPLNEMRIVQFLFERKAGILNFNQMNIKHMKKSMDWHKIIKLRKTGLLHIASFVEAPSQESLDYFYSIQKKTKI